MDSDYVWAVLGLCCLLIMFAMMAAGIRNVRIHEGHSTDDASEDAS